MSPRLASLQSAVKAFTGSTRTFRVITSVPSVASSQSHKLLVILDSSFNPPTLAHLRMCLSALSDSSYPSPKRLILLLATRNADKPAKPATYEQRLAMMELFAKAVISARSKDKLAADDLTIDIALTSAPYFADKAESISTFGAYNAESERIFLTGFDTLIRILHPEYYDKEKKLATLNAFFEHSKLRVAYRHDDQWGGRIEQDAYLESIQRGERDADGADREWVSRGKIIMVEGRDHGQPAISSSKVRSSVKEQNTETWKSMVPASIAHWIDKEHLYREND